MTISDTKCPKCGDENSYHSAFVVECTTVGCENYSKNQAKLVMELEAAIEVEDEEYKETTATTIPSPIGKTTLPCPYGYDANASIDDETNWLIPPIT